MAQSDLKQTETYQALLAAYKNQNTTAAALSAVKYDCEICNDLGSLSYGKTDTNDPLFGEIYPCPECNKGRARLADCGLMTDDLRNLSWESIIDLKQPGMNEAMRKTKSIMAAGHGWIYVWGDWGLGKSLLLQIAVAITMQSGVQAYYTKTVEMMDDLRTSFNPQERTENIRRKIGRWGAVPLLAIDEFEKINSTAFVDERRFQILDDRYRQAISGRGITIIAANVPPQKITDRALVSRITDARFSVVKLSGSDVRLVADKLDDLQSK